MKWFGRRARTVEQVVIQEPGRDCWYCWGHGVIVVTYDGDKETCPKCGGSGKTSRIVRYVEYDER